MPFYVFFYDHNGTENARGPYHSPARAQEKLDSAEGEGVVERYPVGTIEEAIRLHKEKKIDEKGVDAGVRNIRHRPIRRVGMRLAEESEE